MKQHTVSIAEQKHATNINLNFLMTNNMKRKYETFGCNVFNCLSTKSQLPLADLWDATRQAVVMKWIRKTVTVTVCINKEISLFNTRVHSSL
jgi:hypothetical protein